MNHYTFSELTEGLSAEFTVTVTEKMHQSFTELTGDVNPMHMTDEYARTQGYEAKLVYGMLTASLYSTLVGVYLPGEYCLFHEVHTTFNAPVYVGDTLTISGKIIELHEGFKRAKIKAQVVNQKGKKVSRATLTVGVSKE